LKKYETRIDDEIHGTAIIEFAPAVSKIYDQRMKEVMAIYKEILSNHLILPKTNPLRSMEIN
jgi:carboxyl-terminal processing protease